MKKLICRPGTRGEVSIIFVHCLYVAIECRKYDGSK